MVGCARPEGLGMHPDDCGFDVASPVRLVGDGGNHVAATEVDFIFKGEDYGLWGPCTGEIAVERRDGADAGAATAGKREHFIAGMDGARSDLAGEATEILMRPDDALNGQSKSCLCALDGQGQG